MKRNTDPARPKTSLDKHFANAIASQEWITFARRYDSTHLAEQAFLSGFNSGYKVGARHMKAAIVANLGVQQ